MADATDVGSARAGDDAAAGEPDVPAPSHEPLREGIEIRAGLPTMLGRDELPGEIAGLGPVSADVARRAVEAQHRGASWRFAIIDDSGHLLLGGALRRRPATGSAGARVRGGVVELNITPAELAHELAESAGTAWAGVLAEIAAHWAGRHQQHADTRESRRRRFARGGLARHVQIRDRHCCGPGCTRIARRCDLRPVRHEVLLYFGWRWKTFIASPS